jgi:hypothetical protein
MTSPWTGDDQLLAALGEAAAARRSVPPDFLAAAQAAFTWRDIDAELASLTYDSAADQERAPAGTRALPARLRALTFESATLSIELELGQESVLGQLVPAQSGLVEVQSVTGGTVSATVDEVGYFVVSPVPSGWFRLRCHTDGGTDVVTGWAIL